jgi:hypothetical protein
MATPTITIRLPRKLISDMRGVAHRESLKRGATVTWVQLLRELAERHVGRYGEQATAAAGR